MKRLVILPLLLLVGMFAFAQQPSNPMGPVIKFDFETYDYGTIYVDANGDCEFTFTNTGKEPLVLTGVISSCGCTTPSWPREPILPGQKSTIKVKYDTKRLGMINKTITVNSNANNPTVVLKITGNVLPKPTTSVPEKPASSVTPVAK
jgi:hypothetical protein